MDETPLAFDLPSNTTIEQAGTKTASILSTRHDHSNFTVIIFKLKKIPREEFPDGVIIRANPEGWMSENEMLW